MSEITQTDRETELEILERLTNELKEIFAIEATGEPSRHFYIITRFVSFIAKCAVQILIDLDKIKREIRV